MVSTRASLPVGRWFEPVLPQRTKFCRARLFFSSRSACRHSTRTEGAGNPTQLKLSGVWKGGGLLCLDGWRLLETLPSPGPPHLSSELLRLNAYARICAWGAVPVSPLI